MLRSRGRTDSLRSTISCRDRVENAIRVRVVRCLFSRTAPSLSPRQQAPGSAGGCVYSFASPSSAPHVRFIRAQTSCTASNRWPPSRRRAVETLSVAASAFENTRRASNGQFVSRIVAGCPSNSTMLSESAALMHDKLFKINTLFVCLRRYNICMTRAEIVRSDRWRTARTVAGN